MAVNYTVGDGVARIELADAEGHNALTLDVAKELRDALRQAHSDARVSVVLLTGSGSSFSVGTDAGRSTGAAGPAAMLELATVVDEVLRLLESATRPTIAGVDGLAAGAGLSLVLGCDLAIATGRATFSITAPGRPAIPDIGLTWLLPRAVGSQRALSLALVDETIDAERAHQWGLVAQVVDADEFAEHAQELVGRIGGEHAWATNQTRRLMRRTWETSRQETTESEAATLARALMRAR